MKKNLYILLLLAALVTPSAQAGLFKISNRSYTGTAAAQQAEMDAYLNKLEEQVNSNIPNADDGNKYGDALSRSQVTSTSMLGADYATKFHRFLFGAQAVAGTKLGKGQNLGGIISQDDKLQEVEGVGVSSAVYAGANLAQFTEHPHFSRAKVFIGYMTFDRTFSDLKVDTNSLSLKMQYKLFAERNAGRRSMRWNGVDITSGFTYSKVKLSLAKTLSESRTETVAGIGSVTGTAGGTVGIAAELKSFSIPIEASTSVRFLYFLNLYGGLGLDFVQASAKASGSLTNSSFSASPPGGTVSGSPTFDFTTSRKPTPANLRMFMGTQIEMGVVALDVALTRSIGYKTWGVGLGLKGFW